MAVDARFRACGDDGQPCGFDSPDASLTVEARVLEGLTLLGQVGFDQTRVAAAAAADTTWRFLLGARIDLPNHKAYIVYKVSPDLPAKLGRITIQGLGPIPEKPVRRAPRAKARRFWP